MSSLQINTLIYNLHLQWNSAQKSYVKLPVAQRNTIHFCPHLHQIKGSAIAIQSLTFLLVFFCIIIFES